MPANKKPNRGDQRRLRMQQIVLSIIGILIILSMLLALVAN